MLKIKRIAIITTNVLSAATKNITDINKTLSISGLLFS
jgi:hypothetical protein